MIIRTALLVLLAVAGARPAMAQIRLEGTVQLADGSPAVGVTVVVSGLDLREPFKTTTGSRGEYVFANILPGGWIRVDASRDGRVFATRAGLATGSVERMDLNEPRPETVYVDLPRTPREAPVPDPTAARSSAPTESSRGSVPSPTAPPITASPPAPAPVTAAPPASPPRERLSGPGGVRGVVRSADGIGLPGAFVGIEGSGEFVVTDTEGKYALIDLPVDAPLTVIASLDGFEPARREISVTRGAPVTSDFVLPLMSLSERVEVKHDVPLLNATSGASRLTLRPEQVASLPSLGERDIFRALQLLPGISGTQEASSGLYVRGGTPDQNLVTLDGFTLYHVDHLFGYFSAFNMDALDQIEFSKTAFSAADGGRLSGSLHLTGKSLEAPQRTGFINVSMLSAGGLVSMPLGTRGSLLIAGRRSFQSPLYNDILGLVNQGGAAGGGARRPGGPSPFGDNDPFASTPASWFYDVNSKIQLKLSPRDTLAISLYDGRDDVDNSRTLDLGATTFPRFGNQTTAVGLPSDPILNLDEIQRWTNRGVGITWGRQWQPASTTTVSLGGSRYVGMRDFSSSLTSKSTGEDFSFSSGRGGPRGQSESNAVKDLTFRVDHTMSTRGGHQIVAGVEATALDVDYGSQTAAVQAAGPGGGVISTLVDLLDQSGSGQLMAVYAEDTWNPLPRLVVTPGIRLVRYNRTSESFAEPRFVANYQLTSRLQLKGGYGQFHQVIGRIQHEDLSQGDREFWGLADGQTVPVSTARQAMAGASYETAGFLIDAEVYDKQLDRLTLFAPRLTIGVAPIAGSAYLYYGSARAQGVELLFQKKFGRNTGWVSYTQSAAEQLFPDLDTSYFLASHDQNYELKFADTMKIGTRWTMGATWMYGSGRPFTPAVGIESVELPFRDLTVDRITYGAKNSSRLPAYHRLDLSMQGDFRFLGMSNTVGVTAFNVYDRQNVWYRSYQTFGGTGAANDVTLMGRAINVFVKLGL